MRILQNMGKERKFKMKKLLSTVLGLVFAAVLFSSSAGYARADEPDNLALNKWSWLTSSTGGAVTDFNQNGIKIQDFCVGSSNYVMYKANRLDEFRLSMNAKLNLNRPSEKG